MVIKYVLMAVCDTFRRLNIDIIEFELGSVLLWEACLKFVGCLAASPASAH
jgi:hypothetical protein